MQPKFKDKAGHEFTPSELIGATVAYGSGLGTIHRVIETRGIFPVIIVCYTHNGHREWPLDRCTVSVGMKVKRDDSPAKTLKQLLTFGS
tara:strand:+ start:1040 stop:1306 length:267 start_codon:yes stop_codon:yes gene_type:complete